MSEIMGIVGVFVATLFGVVVFPAWSAPICWVGGILTGVLMMRFNDRYV